MNCTSALANPSLLQSKVFSIPKIILNHLKFFKSRNNSGLPTFIFLHKNHFIVPNFIQIPL